MIITEDFIEDGATNKIGISKAQFALLGVEYPPPKGWKKWILGKYISQESAEKYLAFKGIPTKRINKGDYTPVKKKKKKKHRARKIVRLKKGNAEELLRIVEHTPLNKRNLEMFDWLFTQLYEGVPLTDRQKEAVESATIASTRNYPTPRENGYVYLARSHMQKGNLFVKIGYSKNPDKRVKGLQTANPNIRLMHFERGSIGTEREVHDHFKEYRRQGEWFLFPIRGKEIIDEFKKAINEIHEKSEVEETRKLVIKRWAGKKFPEVREANYRAVEDRIKELVQETGKSEIKVAKMLAISGEMKRLVNTRQHI